MDPQDLIQQLITAINSPDANYQQAAPTGSAGLQPFFQLPMYQLLYGEHANQMDPTQRFQADPGFGYNQQMAANQMQQLSAAKGTLQSGPAQRALLTALQGNQNQQYQTWLGQQKDLYSGYQGQLANLAGMGMTQTGADQAMQGGLTLAPLLGGYNMATGQGIGNANLSTGENISSLLGNQGVLGANAYMNTAAALANTNMNIWGMGAQMANNNALGAAGTYNSGQQGMGALLGANAAGGSSAAGGNGSWGNMAANGQQTYTGNPWGYQY